MRCDCCRPLHVAVVQEDLSLVQQILQTVTKLSAPVDCYNNLRQVCPLSCRCHYHVVIIVILTCWNVVHHVSAELNAINQLVCYKLTDQFVKF